VERKGERVGERKGEMEGKRQMGRHSEERHKRDNGKETEGNR
jgi:hypothetical protein